YLWTPTGGNNPTASGLSSGNYVVRVTDANGCFSFVNISIAQPTSIAIQTASTPTTCGSTNGSVSVIAAGGVPGYTYSWSPSGSTASNVSGLTSGSYAVTVTDANGCTITSTSVVSSIGGASASILTSTDVSCSGASNGSATIQVSGGVGPYAYLWSPAGGTSNVASGLPAALYTVQVTDATGCVTNVIIPIVEPDPISVTTTTTPAACNGGNNGSAQASVFGGTSPYSYSWSPSGGTGAQALGLSQGIYNVVVTDANGCVETAVAQVNSNSGIQNSVNTTDVSCFGGNNGNATITTNGGSSPYTYSWSPGNYSSAAVGNLTNGTYQVVITDATGCSQTQLVIINSPPQLTLSASGATTLCNAQFANLAAQAGGGTTPYSYSWSNGSTDSVLTVSPVQSTVYSVSVTDANGCTTSPQVLSVAVLPPLQVVATGDDTLCFGSSATVSAQAIGGDGAYQYSWNNGSAIGASFTIQPASDTTFTVTVVDGCGQPVYDQVSIWVRPGPVVAFGPGSISGCSPVTVNFNDLSTAPSGSTYSWNFGDQQSSNSTNPVHIYTQPGDYTVSLTVSSPGGCSGSEAIPQLVHVEGYPSAGFNQSATDIDLLESQVIFTNTSNTEPGSTYVWDFGDGSTPSNDASPVHQYSQIGSYPVTLIVTTPAGCVDTIYGEVRVAENFAIYIPNAFTPNGDHVNDSFNAFGVGISKFDMFIYDRWGLQLFHSTSLDNNWDGSVHENGNPCQNDVYEYVIFAEDMKGKRHKYVGHVTLVR
ncbi:MAG: PKD domain-containing protein, partial [Bacteroidota bacterium]